MSSFLQRRDRRTFSESITLWVTVEENVLSEEDAITYRKRKEAIDLYSRGVSIKKITLDTGVSKKDLYRFLDRCETKNPDGRLNGWRGLIPREHVVLGKGSSADDYSRLGHANQFLHFLNTYPGIKTNLESLAKCGKRLGEKGPKRKLSITKIRDEMRADCRRAGLKVSDYPLSVASEAYGAIRRYVAQVRGEISASSSAVGGVSALPPVTRCFQRLEADGHWKDIICTVEFPSPTGRGVYYLPIDRLWIIPVLETQSTAALGYSIAYGGNYSGGDLIRAIRSGTLPWVPMELTAPGLKYNKNGGFPSGMDEHLAFICSDEILLDNHRGHLSRFAVSQIHRTIGATPVFGAIENPNARACAEGFFSLIEQMVFHTLPSSTGSNSNNRDIRDPAGNAVKYGITDVHVHEIAEVSIARYNSESPPGASLSRIEILQRYVQDPMSLVRRIPKADRENISLYDLELVLTIRGNLKDGIRPHIYYLESRYTNSVIAGSYGLIGKKINAYGFSGDIRTFPAFFQSGASAGTLLCERRFRSTPHSVLTRKHANYSRRTGGHKPNLMGDDIAGYTESITAKALKSKSAATEFARLKAEERARLRDQKQQGMAASDKSDRQEGKGVNETQENTGSWTDKLSKFGTQF